MRIYNLYILSISGILLLSTVVMIALELRSIITYYTVYVVEALAITELYIQLDKQARRSLTLISIVLFIGFLFAFGLQILEILA